MKKREKVLLEGRKMKLEGCFFLNASFYSMNSNPAENWSLKNEQ